jgi:hypothetical protein
MGVGRQFKDLMLAITETGMNMQRCHQRSITFLCFGWFSGTGLLGRFLHSGLQGIAATKGISGCAEQQRKRAANGGQSRYPCPAGAHSMIHL